jgi:hypothetical protein
MGNALKKRILKLRDAHMERIANRFPAGMMPTRDGACGRLFDTARWIPSPGPRLPIPHQALPERKHRMSMFHARTRQ